jgi:molybdate transport system substrate-binding protein
MHRVQPRGCQIEPVLSEGPRCVGDSLPRPRDVAARTPCRIQLMRRAVLSFFCGCVLSGVVACGGRGSGDHGPVLVAAAVSLSTVLEELGAQYTRETGAPVRFNFAASNVLARQIVEGASVDVFISADETQMRTPADAGLVDAGTRVVLVTNQLAVVVRQDWPRALHRLTDLGATDVTRIALGDPAAVPAGVYARQALERAGVWTLVQPRVVATVSVRAALAAVDEGNADVGVVYRTDMAVARRARLAFVIEPADAPPISYPAAVMTRAPHGAAARAWLAWLQRPAARTVFERHGFGVPSRAS